MKRYTVDAQIPVGQRDVRIVIDYCDAIVKSLGVYPTSSGFGFGFRDMQFDVASLNEAENIANTMSELLESKGYTVVDDLPTDEKPQENIAFVTIYSDREETQ